MTAVMIPNNTLQFQYFGDFNKCLWAIYFQLSFENFWLYHLGEVVLTQNYQKLLKPPFKVCKLKIWVKQPPDIFQNVKTVLQSFIRVNKNSYFNQSFCIGLSGFTFAVDISCSILRIFPWVISSSATW